MKAPAYRWGFLFDPTVLSKQPMWRSHRSFQPGPNFGLRQGIEVIAH